MGHGPPGKGSPWEDASESGGKEVEMGVNVEWWEGSWDIPYLRPRWSWGKRRSGCGCGEDCVCRTRPLLSLYSGFPPVTCLHRNHLATGQLICKNWVHCWRRRLQSKWRGSGGKQKGHRLYPHPAWLMVLDSGCTDRQLSIRKKGFSWVLPPGALGLSPGCA